MSKRKYHKSNCDATVRAIVIVITISQPRYAVTNILLYIIPTLIGIYFGVKVIKHE